VKTRVFNKEVLFADESIVTVEYQDIQQLKEYSDLNERKRIRLCAHRDIEDRIHEMLIIHAKNTYVRPHKHINKTESFHIIEGTADIVIFSEDGTILDLIEMSDYSGGQIFYYRLSDARFHTVFIKSEVVVFHETTNGPFCREDTVFAEWSPHDNEVDATHRFLENLGSQLTEFKRGWQ